MKLMKRAMAVGLAAVMAANLAACGAAGKAEPDTTARQESGTETQAQENQAQETAAEKAPVTIKFMHGMIEEERQAVIQGLIDDFTKENPWITIEQMPTDDGGDYDTKLTALAGSAEMPAIIEVNQNRAKWLAENELTDLEALRTVIDSGTADYYDAVLKINTTEDGQDYIGVPMGGWVQGIWYNKTAFDEKGLKAPDTWENILTAAKAFHDPDNKKYGIALPTVDAPFSEQSFSQFALSNDANALDTEGNASFNTPEMVEALTFYKELYQYSIQGSNNTTEVQDAMLNGSVPMGIYSTYILSALIKAGVMDDYGFALVTNKDSAAYGSIGMLTITDGLTPEQREAATAFVTYLTKPENNIRWLHMAPGGQQPVMEGIADNAAYLDNEVIQGFAGLSPSISAAFDSISLFGNVDGRNFMSMGTITSSNVISGAVYEVTVNGGDPQSVAEHTQKQIEELIAQ